MCGMGFALSFQTRYLEIFDWNYVNGWSLEIKPTVPLKMLLILIALLKFQIIIDNLIIVFSNPW